MNTEIFTENLKRKRKEKGFTQEAISTQLNISQKRYASWEEGRGNPNFHYLSKLCEVLEIDDLYLFISKELVEN